LRVGTHDDLHAARHFVRPHSHRAAGVLNPFLGSVDRGHVEIVGPARWLAGARRHHRADALAGMVDEAIVAHLAHRHRLVISQPNSSLSSDTNFYEVK
jgi:hypothetical protein